MPLSLIKQYPVTGIGREILLLGVDLKAYAYIIQISRSEATFCILSLWHLSTRSSRRSAFSVKGCMHTPLRHRVYLKLSIKNIVLIGEFVKRYIADKLPQILSAELKMPN